MAVRFVSTKNIRPSTNSNESTRRLELTPWDLQLLLVDYIQKGLLFYIPTNLQENPLGNTLIHHLESSFSRTLEIFYPLAGRLSMVENEDDTTSFFVDCNGAGAQFVHAIADGVTVADILDPIYVPEIVNSFFLLNRVLNYEGVSEPLLGVQITELVDGFFIGCSANHSVIDGSSFWDFFNTWSEISQTGSVNSSRPLPIFDKSYLNGIIDFPIRFQFPENEIPEKTPLPELQQRVFHFSKMKIAELKAQANAEMVTNKISSLQILLSHLWRSVSRCRRLSPDQEVHYKVVVGMRQRIQPPLPEQYVGNAVLFGEAIATSGELLRHGPGWVAWKINQVIAGITAEENRKYLEIWVENPKFATMSKMKENNNSLATGSSPRFNMYGNDFGWGKPVAVRSGIGNKFDGKLTVYPGAEEGSIDFECCLFAGTLQAMAEDTEFMEALSLS